MPFHGEKKRNYEKLFFRLPHKRFLVYFVWYTGKRRLRRWFIHRMHAKEKGGGWRLEVGFGREWKPKWIEALRVAVPRNFRTNILLTLPHLFPAFPDSSHFITQPGSHRIASHHISQTFCTWFNVTPRQRPSRPWLGRTLFCFSFRSERLRFVAFANFPAANGVTICHCYSRCFLMAYTGKSRVTTWLLCIVTRDNTANLTWIL